MKRLLTLALLTISLQFAFAHIGGSILNIRTSDSAPFRIVIDGQDMLRANGVVRLNDIAPGRHYIQVLRGSKILQNAGDLYLYNGTIDITANTESFVTVISGFNKIRFDNIIALNSSPWQQPGRPIVPQAPVNPNECKPYVPAGPIAMAPYDFEQLKGTLNNASFESTKMQILKQALPFNYFTTQQVRELMSEFNFESSKLEVAKAAYVKTLDQQNYYLVNNEFSFGSSVRELGEYLAMN